MAAKKSQNLKKFPDAGSVDVLCVCYGGGHVQAIVPVAEALMNQGISVSVLALTTAIHDLQKTNVPNFSYMDFPSASHPRTKLIGELLAADVQPNKRVPADETVAYMGINYCDLADQFGEKESARLWSIGGRQNFLPVKTMGEILSLIKPRALVSTNSPRTERASIEAATKLNIPALCIVDLFALREVEWICNPEFGNRVCVLNDAVKDMFVQRGRPAADIDVTGNPAFDNINAPTIVEKGKKLRELRKWGRGKTTILYASAVEPSRHPFTGESGDPRLTEDIERELRQFVLKNQYFELVIRRHPSLDQTCATGERIYQSKLDEDINVLLHAVDIVVVTASTVGLQAYLAGRSVIAVESSVMAQDSPYSKFGMATAAKTVRDLNEILKASAFKLHDHKGALSQQTASTKIKNIIVRELL